MKNVNRNVSNSEHQAQGYFTFKFIAHGYYYYVFTTVEWSNCTIILYSRNSYGRVPMYMLHEIRFRGKLFYVRPDTGTRTNKKWDRAGTLLGRYIIMYYTAVFSDASSVRQAVNTSDWPRVVEYSRYGKQLRVVRT